MKLPAAGHNSVPHEQLRSLIERIERLIGERDSINDDIRNVFGEAKANGFDVKTMRKVIQLRKMDATEREEMDAILELYMIGLGMKPNETP